MITTETQRALRKRKPIRVSWSAELIVICVLCGCFFLDSAQTIAAPQEVVPVNGAAFRAERAIRDEFKYKVI